MSLYETYDVILHGGVVKEYPIGKTPITAEKRRLNADGGEVHSGYIVVNPLNRMPSIDSMIKQMERSGQLAARVRAAQNLQLAEDGDPTFEGYSREWLEENWLSQHEADFMLEQAAQNLPQEPNAPFATTPASTTSTQTDAAPSPKEIPSQSVS